MLAFELCATTSAPQGLFSETRLHCVALAGPELYAAGQASLRLVAVRLQLPLLRLQERVWLLAAVLSLSHFLTSY